MGGFIFLFACPLCESLEQIIYLSHTIFSLGYFRVPEPEVAADDALALLSVTSRALQRGLQNSYQ